MDRHFIVFTTVVEKENFTRAAEVLHLTQSAVSLHIKKLENYYGIQLFERSNKYVRLTKAGEILYFHSKNIVDQYAQVQKEIDNLINEADGPLSIGSDYSFGEYILPTLISKFVCKYPNVSPNITIKNKENITSHLLNRDLDLGILDDFHIDRNKTEVFPLMKDELVIIVPSNHRLARSREVDLEELANESWILRNIGSSTRKLTEEMFSNLNFSPKKMMSFGTPQAIKRSVEEYLGISVISKSAIQKEIFSQTITPLKIKNYSIERQYFCVMNTSKFKTRTIELFLQFLTTFQYQTIDTVLVEKQ
ncbi:LysR substrate-binding domain-containing protein [Jeotgalibacillus marinus]|uniref:LysR family transcriptional regulator n=1 Tax=Jeotgalibacillus marinus TaxID=86667 RepID=A0ABV3Q5K9_9BACL